MSLLDSKKNAPKDEARLEINGELKFLLKQVIDTLLVLNKIDRCTKLYLSLLFLSLSLILQRALFLHRPATNLSHLVNPG